MAGAVVTQMRAPAPDCIEVLLTPGPNLYAEMGENIAAIRKRLNLAPSVSNTQVIAEALRRTAEQG
jgi:hypothetical protein